MASVFSMELHTLLALPKLFMTATLPGWMGVNLFFVLSGFLITGILFDSKNRPDYYRRFYTRRALRILPAYYALLIILSFVPLTGLFFCRRITWPFIALSAVYLSNITPLLGVHAQYAALWSLAVEEHFYLLWPAIVRKLSDKTLSIVAGALVVLCPIERAITYKLGYAASSGYTWLVADGLALGALLAICLRRPWTERKLGTCFALGLPSAGLLLLAIGQRFGILQGTHVLGATLRPERAKPDLLRIHCWSFADWHDSSPVAGELAVAGILWNDQLRPLFNSYALF